MPQPITAREFADAGHAVLATCQECGHAHRLDLETIVFMLGDDFPLAISASALSGELHCGACGAPKPAISWEPAVALEDTETFVRERPSRRQAS